MRPLPGARAAITTLTAGRTRAATEERLGRCPSDPAPLLRQTTPLERGVGREKADDARSS
jgi:hypothetical protein